jgi:hypothetical protein
MYEHHKTLGEHYHTTEYVLLPLFLFSCLLLLLLLSSLYHLPSSFISYNFKSEFASLEAKRGMLAQLLCG